MRVKFMSLFLLETLLFWRRLWFHIFSVQRQYNFLTVHATWIDVARTYAGIGGSGGASWDEKAAVASLELFHNKVRYEWLRCWIHLGGGKDKMSAQLLKSSISNPIQCAYDDGHTQVFIDPNSFGQFTNTLDLFNSPSLSRTAHILGYL